MSVLRFPMQRVKGTAKRPAPGLRFYCVRCNCSDRFAFDPESGAVSCSSCNSYIANLKVVRI